MTSPRCAEMSRASAASLLSTIHEEARRRSSSSDSGPSRWGLEGVRSFCFSAFIVGSLEVRLGTREARRDVLRARHSAQSPAEAEEPAGGAAEQPAGEHVAHAKGDADRRERPLLDETGHRLDDVLAAVFQRASQFAETVTHQTRGLNDARTLFLSCIACLVSTDSVGVFILHRSGPWIVSATGLHASCRASGLETSTKGTRTGNSAANFAQPRRRSVPLPTSVLDGVVQFLHDAVNHLHAVISKEINCTVLGTQERK